MNKIRFGTMDIPENAINKIYVLKGRGEFEECILQDMLGHEYVLASGEYCDVYEYRDALMKVLGWTDKSVPAVPILIKEYKAVKNGEDFTITTNPDAGFSIPEYISSSEEVAMVDPSGNVTIVNTGYTEIDIYFTEPYRVLYKRIYLSVFPATPSINRTSREMVIHSTARVKMKEAPEFYSPEWVSTNGEIATVSHDGVIDALKVGTTKINGYYKLPYKVQVEEVSLKVSPSLIRMEETVRVGDKKTVVMPTIDGYTNPQWSSDRNDIIEVDTSSGLLTIKKVGNATITGAYLNPDKIEVKEIYFTVHPAEPDVNHTSKQAKVGESFQVNMLPIEGFSEPTWVSTNLDICYVNPQGNADAREAGSCTLQGFYTEPYTALVQEIDVDVQV